MNRRLTWVFCAISLASLVAVAFALSFWGAHEIRENSVAIFMLTLAGGASMFLCQRIFDFLGISLGWDIFERQNPAALLALSGAQSAVAAIYIGGSVGEGPSYAENFFCLALGVAAIVLLWFLFELTTHVSISITEERDLSSGLRFGVLLVTLGLILGRALAGDWQSVPDTIQDFIHDGWPAAVLTGVAIPIEISTRPTRNRPFPPWTTFGLLPALLYLALTAIWLWRLGSWKGTYP